MFFSRTNVNFDTSLIAGKLPCMITCFNLSENLENTIS